MRTIINDINILSNLDDHQLMAESKNMGAPFDLVKLVSTTKNFLFQISVLEE